MNYTDLATTVTARLVDQIETGPGAWRMPWHTVPGLFDVRNASTGNCYRGANVVALALEAIEAEHPTGWWSTYRQWSELDTPGLYVSSGDGEIAGLSVGPGGVLVVWGVIGEAAVEVADEPVAEGSEGLVV